MVELDPAVHFIQYLGFRRVLYLGGNIQHFVEDTSGPGLNLLPDNFDVAEGADAGGNFVQEQNELAEQADCQRVADDLMSRDPERERNADSAQYVSHRLNFGTLPGRRHRSVFSFLVFRTKSANFLLLCGERLNNSNSAECLLHDTIDIGQLVLCMRRHASD